MKRSKDNEARRLPASRPLLGNIMLYGNICLDMTFQLPSYPKEDSSQRATGALELFTMVKWSTRGFRKQIGGNCANSCIVLKQLVPNAVQPLAAVPRKGSSGAAQLQITSNILCSRIIHMYVSSFRHAYIWLDVVFMYISISLYTKV